MNSPADDDSGDLRYAEYVLGVLDADARAVLEREIASSSAAAAAAAQWRRRLEPLVEEISPETPPEVLWEHIRAALDADARNVRPRRGLWENLRLWHWLALGSGALLAAACAALVFMAVHQGPSPPIPYMAATITETNGQVGWTATMDLRHARMIVVPASPQPVRPNRTPELWLIPSGGKPIAVGLISTHAPTTLTLNAHLLTRLGPTARLAVSIEPHGGSPTGQPTGPVVATGAIGAAPAGARAARITPLRHHPPRRPA